MSGPVTLVRIEDWDTSKPFAALCPLPCSLNEAQTSWLSLHCTGHEQSQTSEHNLHSLCAEWGADWNLMMDYIKYVCDLKFLLPEV